jgi:hypothetical protein
MRCQLTVDGSEVRGDWKLKNHGNLTSEFHLDPKSTHPVHLAAAEKALDRMRANPQGASFTFSIKLPFTQWRARVALLRMAYLMMFRQFGYSYAIHPCCRRLRKQILSPEGQLIPNVFSIRLDDHTHANCVALITEPAEYKAFCVILKFRTQNRTLVQGVMMPGPGQDEAAFHKRFAEMQETTNHFKGKFTIVPYKAKWLSHPDYVDYLPLAWDENELYRFIRSLKG